MNAKLGIVIREGEWSRLLSPVAPRLRAWGDEIFEEDGASRAT